VNHPLQSGCSSIEGERRVGTKKEPCAAKKKKVVFKKHCKDRGKGAAIKPPEKTRIKKNTLGRKK